MSKESWIDLEVLLIRSHQVSRVTQSKASKTHYLNEWALFWMWLFLNKVITMYDTIPITEIIRLYVHQILQVAQNEEALQIYWLQNCQGSDMHDTSSKSLEDVVFFQLVFATHSSKLRNHLPRYWSHWSTNSSTVLDHPLPSILAKNFHPFCSQEALSSASKRLDWCNSVCLDATSFSRVARSWRPLATLAAARGQQQARIWTCIHHVNLSAA